MTAPTGRTGGDFRALAARAVGRRVRLTGGHVGTVTRVNGRGLTVTVPNVTAADILEYLPD